MRGKWNRFKNKLLKYITSKCERSFFIDEERTIFGNILKGRKKIYINLTTGNQESLQLYKFLNTGANPIDKYQAIQSFCNPKFKRTY